MQMRIKPNSPLTEDVNWAETGRRQVRFLEFLYNVLRLELRLGGEIYCIFKHKTL